MPLTEPGQLVRYKACLRSLMSYVHGNAYDSAEREFSVDELQVIRPEHIYRWMALKAYGLPEPRPGDNPTKARASCLEYDKKAISYFMCISSRTGKWEPRTGSGNPTQSPLVLDLLKAIKKKEVQRQGKASKVVRPLEEDEFISTLLALRAYIDTLRRYQMPALCLFQFHMIGRIDDCCKLLKENLGCNQQFPFVLTARLCWSKNIREERDSPTQILLGSMSSTHCVLLALAAYLEIAGENIVSQSSVFVFEMQTNTPQNAKSRASRILRDVWRNASSGFIRSILLGAIGTHSTRKYAATHARRNGCSRDDINARGRWKRLMKQVDTYINTLLPFPDAKVAAALCVGGACKYCLKNGIGLSEEWLLRNVVPNIAREYGQQVALVLAMPLLWSAFEPTLAEFLPESMRQRIRSLFFSFHEQLAVHDEGVDKARGDVFNPVERRLIVINGCNGELFIDEVGAYVGEGIATTAGGGRAATHDRNEILGIYAKQNEMQRSLIKLESQMGANHSLIVHELRRVQTGLLRMSRLPTRQLRGQEGLTSQAHLVLAACPPGGPGIPLQLQQENQAAVPQLDEVHVGNSYMGSLCKTPSSLFTLWEEYEVGIGGRKAARLFTRAERGKVKVQYCRRKSFWDIVSTLIRAGHTPLTAIDMIYDAYGRVTPVTSIINQMMRDGGKNGVYPALLRAHLPGGR